MKMGLQYIVIQEYPKPLSCHFGAKEVKITVSFIKATKLC